MTRRDIAIIGAGPYGLATAAHLRTVKGLDVAVFGEPMSFWDRNMPIGMMLRSNWTATQIAHPLRALTLENFAAATGNQASQPVPLDHFLKYGIWYQRKAIPDLDRRQIVRVEAGSNGFHLTACDGETFQCGRVIVAAGIGSFARIPQPFQNLPSALVSHASAHRDLSRFTGKSVLVIGSGQSALESGALLHEGGAQVEIAGRAQHLHWLQGRLSRTLHHGLGKFARNLLYAPTDVGPAGLSQLMARPGLVKRLPRSLQDRLRKRCIRPAGARWLVDRLQGVPIRLGHTATSARETGAKIEVTFDDGTARTADHVLLGTGYQIDIAKYEFLAPQLLDSIKRFNGFPILGRGLETSVPRLHMIGAPAAWSCGPLVQFVSGTTYASRSLLQHVAGKQLAAYS